MTGMYLRTPEIRAKQSASMRGRFVGEDSPSFGLKRSAETRKKLSDLRKGVTSPFKGKKHSDASKQNMSFGRIGVVLTTAQRAERKKQKTKEWMAANPETMRGYDQKYLERKARRNSERRRAARLAGIEKLGGRCSSPTCAWVNEDGSKGCTDFRVLQFDHVDGGGTKERKSGSFEKLCKEVLEDRSGKFQLLCSNCNWIKAFEKREFLFRYAAEEALR